MEQTVIDFGREVCGDLASAARREWLVTNGIGGYASGTLGGLLSRRYHGLLVAALRPPLGRTLLLTKLDEVATYDDGQYPLSANHWSDDLIDPLGFHHLERFRLEGTTPAWTFACGDASLEKCVWMQPGANTTYIRYDLRRASAPLKLDIKAFVNYRDHHASTFAGDWRMRVEPVERGLRVTAFDGATPFYLLSDRAEAAPKHEWYRDYFLSVEDYRGLDALDDNLYAGDFQATLLPGESLTLVASTEASPALDGASAYAERQAYERQLLVGAGLGSSSSEPVEHLVLAADQFVASRTHPSSPSGVERNEKEGGSTIIAGYPWFGDWGRDTMISLPGLTLATGRHDVAARILRTFAHFVDQGMLPNRFPDEGETPEYNTVDATLWFFEAIRAYHAATADDALLRDLFPVLQDIVEWHQRGTRYQIHLDPADGLLYAGGRAAYLDGCQGWRLGRDAADWQAGGDQRALVQCPADHG
jgi:predicted glycogen debranching enzyme